VGDFELISDLHLDIRRDPMRLLMDIEPDSETLVIAGDLCEARNLKPEWIRVLADKYEIVLYVPGNHEYYGLQATETLDKLFRMMLDNTYVMHDSSIALGDISFSGSTLWFPDRPGNVQCEQYMSDFAYIPFFKDWVYQSHENSKRWLPVTGTDVWITHHLPLWKSVHPKYEGSNLNRFFVGDLSAELQEMDEPPKVIVHGHTHEDCDYMAGNTRIVCNPLGYPQEGRHSILPVKISL